MIIKTIDQIYGDYQDDNTENKIKLFSIQHQVVFTSAIRMFKDNTLFGIGPKMFREKCKEDRYQVFTELDHSVNGCQTHPHNIYVQLLAETGLFGTLPIIILFVFLFYQIFIKSLLLKHIYKNKFSNIDILLMSALFVNLC